MLGVIVDQVSDAGLPVDEELTLGCVIAYPKEAHVNRFQSFLFNGVIGEAVGGRVVYLDWSGRTWVPEFADQGMYLDIFLAVDVGVSDLGFVG